MNNHYDQKYFDWQKKLGRVAVTCDYWKFDKFIKPTDVVLDFGCGGGYFLAAYRCKERYGVELNPHARQVAEENGVTVVETIEDLPKDVMFDLIISNHALEHVHNPLDVIKRLYPKLKDTGKIVFYVPIKCREERKYTEKDINQHLYCWTPLLLGNLFATAGFKVKQARFVIHAWPPLIRYLCHMPGFLFHPMCFVWCIITDVKQTMIVAGKS
ncbi:MAG: class I SAM-dependent methyltransferase [Verrucomicrobiota bacterium]|jgi:SAM-dependent methyltransferase